MDEDQVRFLIRCLEETRTPHAIIFKSAEGADSLTLNPEAIRELKKHFEDYDAIVDALSWEAEKKPRTLLNRVLTRIFNP